VASTPFELAGWVIYHREDGDSPVLDEMRELDEGRSQFESKLRDARRKFDAVGPIAFPRAIGGLPGRGNKVGRSSPPDVLHAVMYVGKRRPINLHYAIVDRIPVLLSLYPYRADGGSKGNAGKASSEDAAVRLDDYRAHQRKIVTTSGLRDALLSKHEQQPVVVDGLRRRVSEPIAVAPEVREFPHLEEVRELVMLKQDLASTVEYEAVGLSRGISVVDLRRDVLERSMSLGHKMLSDPKNCSPVISETLGRQRSGRPESVASWSTTKNVSPEVVQNQTLLAADIACFHMLHDIPLDGSVPAYGKVDLYAGESSRADVYVGRMTAIATVRSAFGMNPLPIEDSEVALKVNAAVDRSPVGLASLGVA
jgi:hypothetical protein